MQDEEREESLARIPFTRREEQTIASMAKWMHFVAIFMIVVGAIGLLVMMVSMSMAGRVLASAGLPGSFWLIAVLSIGLIAVVIWQGSLLHSASEKFHLVADTDDADQQYAGLGFEKLRVFFAIEVVFSVLGLLSVIATIVSL